MNLAEGWLFRGVNDFIPHNYRLQLAARVFLAGRPQLKRSVSKAEQLEVKYILT
jgi:hypothetical protein